MLGTAAGGAMRLPRRHSERPLMVMVSPVRGALLNVDGVCALLFISDPDAIAEVPEKLLARLYALTPAEARLAAALMGGDGPTEYAERAGLSRHTVRTHLNRVLAKTGTRRQSELMKLLWTGPAVFDASFAPEIRPRSAERGPVREGVYP